MPSAPCPRSQVRRPAGVVLAVAGAGALLLAGCGGSSSGGTTTGSSAVPSVSATTAPPGASVATPTPATTPDDAQVIAVTLAHGSATGVQPRTDVKRGTRVRISVTSDVAEVLHVHGYELEKDVAAGQATQLEFVADTPGVFEVELHTSKKVLTRLQVQ
jgi:FtsP/CotA-like multicopper oxidase with cupredoxin domain